MYSAWYAWISFVFLKRKKLFLHGFPPPHPRKLIETPTVSKSPHLWTKGQHWVPLLCLVFADRYSAWTSCFIFVSLPSLITNKAIFFLTNLPVVFMVRSPSLATSSIDVQVRLLEMLLSSLYILNSDLLY